MWGWGQGTQGTTPVSTWDPEKGTPWEEDLTARGRSMIAPTILNKKGIHNYGYYRTFYFVC